MKWHSAELRDTLTTLKTRSRHRDQPRLRGRMGSKHANVDPKEMKIVFIENPDVLSKAENIQEMIREKTKRVDIHMWSENEAFDAFFNSTIKPNEPHVLLYTFPYTTTVVDGDIKKVNYIKKFLGEKPENYILPVIICEGGELTEEKKESLMKQVQDKLELKRFCGIGENETTEEQVNKLMEKIKELIDGNHNEGYKWKPVTDPKDQPKESGWINFISPLFT